MSTIIHNTKLLEQQAETARQNYEQHLLEYQRLVEQTADVVLQSTQSWDLSRHANACPDVSVAQRLEAEHDSLRDQYLATLHKFRNAEKQQPHSPSIQTNGHQNN